MSQITFSHQFPQRWLTAPQPVKDAIVQELDDIVKLLDKDTDIDEFTFSTPNLRQYIDTIYAELATERKTANTSNEASSHPNAIQSSQQAYDADRSHKGASTELDTQSPSLHVDDESAHQYTNDDKNMDTDAVIVPMTTPDYQNNEPTVYNQLDDAFLNELEGRIDDYLSEQLSTISQNLKDWLREEVKQHLDNQ